MNYQYSFILFHFALFLILVYWIEHLLHQQQKQMKKPATKGQLSVLFDPKNIKAREKLASQRNSVVWVKYLTVDFFCWLFYLQCRVFTYPTLECGII